MARSGNSDTLSRAVRPGACSAGGNGPQARLDRQRVILRRRRRAAKDRPQEEKDAHRRSRRIGFGKLKATAAEITRRDAIAVCGINGETGVKLQISQGAHASYGGVRVCKAGWLCVDCALYLANKRAEIVLHRFEQLKAQHPEGGHFFLLTLTLHRAPGIRLKDAMAGLRKAHNSMTSGQAWQDIKEELGGSFTYVRGREVMLSPSLAWGPHDHWSVFIPGAQPVEDKLRVLRKVVDRFLHFARKAGFRSTLAGQDVQVAEDPTKAAEYATKGSAASRWSVVDEATGGGRKDGAQADDFGRSLVELRKDAEAEGRGISIWRLLASAHGGDPDARALVEDYAEGTHRQRVVATSRNIRLTPDEDMPEPEAKDEPEPLADLANSTMRRLGQVGAAELRNAVEVAFAAGGRDQVFKLLCERLRGQRWRWCPDPNAVVCDRLSAEDWDAIEGDLGPR